MDWIKKNPAKFSLAIVAILVVALTALLYTKVSAFDSNFDSTRGTSISKAPVPPLDTTELDAAREAIGKPVVWQPAQESGRLLVSKLYVLFDGRLKQTGGESFHPPIPNKWLEKYKLNVLSATVLDEDPDQDGFTTLEEFNGLDTLSHLDNNGPVMGSDGTPLPDDSTNPIDPNSHPPYHTKLELVRVVFIPFRLRLMSYDINPKNPKDITVQINTIDLKNRTLFVPITEDIPGTKFKVDSFQQKEVDGADGTKKDVSEVTIINKETGDKVVLPYRQIVDSPDSYAIFRYRWVKPGPKKEGTADFPKRRAETFALPPEADKIYKVIEIRGQQATVELPEGTKKILTPKP